MSDPIVPLLLLAVAGAASPAPPSDPPCHRTEEVRYASGEVELAAALLLPPAPAPVPGAVIVHGSGSSDRSNAWARAVAEELARNGVAVLLTDKRGSGASGGDWRTAGFEELAADALAGAALLRRHPGVDPARVGVVGLSQGGWVAPLAAARDDSVAFVITLSGAAVSFAEQTFAEMANTARAAGLAPPQVQEVLALHRETARYLTTGDWARYARAREQGVRSAWRPIAEGYPPRPDLPIWTFLRKVADFDPIPYWMQLTQPVFVAYGAEDEADNVPVRESVRRLDFAFGLAGKRNHEVVVVPGVGHAIGATPGELAPELRAALAAWLSREVGVVAPRCPG